MMRPNIINSAYEILHWL